MSSFFPFLFPKEFYYFEEADDEFDKKIRLLKIDNPIAVIAWSH